MPLDLQYATQVSHVEAVKFLFLPHVGSPRLTSIEEGAEYAGLLGAQSGLLNESGVVPYPLVQLGHDCGCLGDPTVGLRVDGQRAGDGGPEVSEVFNDFRSVSVDGHV